MRSLPFVVKPRSTTVIEDIGNEEIGIIKIERRGYLNVTEKTFVDQASNSSQTIANTVALATKISSKTKKTVEDCYSGIMKAVQGGLDDKFAARIKEEYPEEIGEIMNNLIEAATRRNLACANILIVSRIDPEWTLEDTLEQHPGMIEALAEFYTEEENGKKPESKEGEAKELTKSEEEAEVSELVGK